MVRRMLLTTSSVPGTEGHKKKLRFDAEQIRFHAEQIEIRRNLVRMHTFVGLPCRPWHFVCPSCCCRLYFSEVNGNMHGPMFFTPDEPVEVIQQWLDEETFRSHCVDETTNTWVAHAEISTSCGLVLTEFRNLNEYPVSDEDILTVILVSADEVTRWFRERPCLLAD